MRFSSLGNTRSIAAGRISYVFGFQGPTMQLDTTLFFVFASCSFGLSEPAQRRIQFGFSRRREPHVVS